VKRHPAPPSLPQFYKEILCRKRRMLHRNGEKLRFRSHSACVRCDESPPYGSCDWGWKRMSIVGDGVFRHSVPLRDAPSPLATADKRCLDRNRLNKYRTPFHMCREFRMGTGRHLIRPLRGTFPSRGRLLGRARTPVPTMHATQGVVGNGVYDVPFHYGTPPPPCDRG